MNEEESVERFFEPFRTDEDVSKAVPHGHGHSSRVPPESTAKQDIAEWREMFWGKVTKTKENKHGRLQR